MERQVAHSEKNEKETQDKNFLRLLKFKAHFSISSYGQKRDR